MIEFQATVCRSQGSYLETGFLQECLTYNIQTNNYPLRPTPILALPYVRKNSPCKFLQILPPKQFSISLYISISTATTLDQITVISYLENWFYLLPVLCTNLLSALQPESILSKKESDNDTSFLKILLPVPISALSFIHTKLPSVFQLCHNFPSQTSFSLPNILSSLPHSTYNSLLTFLWTNSIHPSPNLNAICLGSLSQS